MSIGLAACGALAIGSVSAQDFVPSGNLWGYAFGDYAVKAHNDTLQRGGGNVQYRGVTGGNSTSAGSTSGLNSTNAGPYNGSTLQSNGFEFRRIYLGYDFKFAPNWSAQVVLANEQDADASGKNTVYVKYANVRWSNFIKNQDLVLGQYQTCSFATAYNTEPLWSYRSVERTIMDMHNVDGSTDMGASLEGKLWKQGGADVADSSKPNMIGYYLQVGNNNTAAISNSNFKKVRANIYGTFMQHALTVGLYGDYMVQQTIGTYGATLNTPATYMTANTTIKAYAAYKTEWFRVGFEFFQQTNLNSDAYTIYDASTKTYSEGQLATGVQMGVSVFASGVILKNKLNIFARYDHYNPDTKWNANNLYTQVYGSLPTAEGNTIKGANLTSATFYTQTFITAGLDWTPTARVHLMPNIWYNGYSAMGSTLSPSSTTDFGARAKNDDDMVYRLTFYFLFNQSKKVMNNGMSY